ncbi:MAG: efflux RND transporter permease subunit [Deltaproteobacteria bacterium]|nr:efflux RND transporter permease subunit [Deltaproteobacteria bacterium]MBW2395725.1 efflux RND transporter permease subunit [Deltaproteobacteria bacterium]
MILSDFSVRRPVVATVLSLLLVILGLAALAGLPVRQYPDIDPPVVSIQTVYRGANAEILETKVTQVIEDRIAGLEGIEKLTSSSSEERSSIRVEFSLDRDIDEAANDIRDRVARVAADLPDEADPPEIAKVDNDTSAVMYLNLTSEWMNGLELTDYADRYLTDRFSTVPGVARVRLSGERRYAMRVWIDRESLAAHGLTVVDVEMAMRAENVELPAGRLESSQREFSLRTDTGFRTPEEFGRLVLGRGSDGQLVHLAEVADVRVGAENERNVARANTVPAVSLGIEQLSKANSLEVSRGVRAEIERVQSDLPEGMTLEVNYDRADYIGQSMAEVVYALGFAISLVLLVIYFFLGNLRATLIPAVVVPVSVVATFIVMGFLGYTVNILTLLGLVLAIGLVVDDSIVVLENIYRRVEEGRPPLLAALEGSREIGFAVIATTLVLVAVFVPLSFIRGDIGRLFNEFGITLAAAVIFSSFVALTLTPMMCSRLLRARRTDKERAGLAHRVDVGFQRLSAGYRAVLERVVAQPWVTLGGAAAVSALAVLLLQVIPSEYAPQEDRGAMMMMVRAPEGASFDYMDRYARKIETILMEEVEDGPLMRFLLRLPGGWGGTGAVNSARFIVLLDPWDDRDENQSEVSARLLERLRELPGVRVMIFPSSSLGVRSDGRPLKLVIGGPDYERLEKWRDILLETMEAMPALTGPDSNYQERKPRMTVRVDRDRAATLGVSLAEIGRTLETMLGSRVVTTYVDRGREYDVILQGENADRASPDDLTNLYVRSSLTERLISLSNLVTLEEEAGPELLSRFDRMRAITVEAALAPGVSLGEGVRTLGESARRALPGDARLSWDGESREYLESGSSLYLTFALALLIVFLVLAAQFESFTHPFIIMGTVPLALTGALLGLWLMGGTINVFSQIGAVLLIGLAAKNGVLIVEFANQLRDRGEEFDKALIDAACIRLRPIVMTSASTTFGALPLLLGSGAGHESRQPIGIVVVSGVVVSAVLTLVVVPALYSVLARRTKSPQHVARAIAKLQGAELAP